MSIREACPGCVSPLFKKNGHIHNGKQNHQCKDCGRQFVVDITHRVIDEDQRLVVECLLCEKISLRGICRALRVSIRWLMDFMVARFAAAPEHLHVRPVAASHSILISRLVVEADALGSFVQTKANPHWLWISMDVTGQRLTVLTKRGRDKTSEARVLAGVLLVKNN